jgi:hypothetical protein
VEKTQGITNEIETSSDFNPIVFPDCLELLDWGYNKNANYQTNLVKRDDGFNEIATNITEKS